MLLFTAGSQGYFLTRSRIWESLLLILVAFTLFRPGFWMDMAAPPVTWSEPKTLVESMAKAEPGSQFRFIVEGEDDVGDKITFTALVDVGDEPTGEERVEAFGLELLFEGDEVIIDNAVYDSKAQAAGLDFDQKIVSVGVPTDQPPKQWMYIPALLLLALIVWLQRRRRQAETVA